MISNVLFRAALVLIYVCAPSRNRCLWCLEVCSITVRQMLEDSEAIRITARLFIRPSFGIGFAISFAPGYDVRCAQQLFHQPMIKVDDRVSS